MVTWSTTSLRSLQVATAIVVGRPAKAVGARGDGAPTPAAWSAAGRLTTRRRKVLLEILVLFVCGQGCGGVLRQVGLGEIVHRPKTCAGQLCHRTVAYRPGNLSQVLTEHYRRDHPEALAVPSR
jgi:hypothetical protein